MIGLLGFIVLHAKRLGDYVKENIGFTIEIKEEAREADIVKLRKTIDASPYAKHTRSISKEEAASILKEKIGEDFVAFLGENPLMASIEVNLNAPYANPDSIAWIKKDISAQPMVNEVIYHESLVRMINENIRKISMILLGFSLLLVIVSIALINNTIRLSIYSKRFLIKSMQLVGATPAFISRPFLWRAIAQGVIAGFIAIALIIAIMLFAQKEIPELRELQDKSIVLVLFGLVIIFGVLFSFISTALSVRRFVRSRTEALY